MSRVSSGQTYGRLTTIEPAGSSRGYVIWRCKCQCGKQADVRSSRLTDGSTKSCGCLAAELAAERCANRAVGFLDRLKTNEKTGCIEWQGSRDKDGYGTLRSGRKDYKAHRVAFERVHGPIPHGMVVCHTCDNPPCCNIDHLFLGTAADNTQDSVSKGRHVHGTRSANAKINDHVVAQIRRMVSQGSSQTKAAKVFGIDQTTVSRIMRRKSWKHVKP